MSEISGAARVKGMLHRRPTGQVSVDSDLGRWIEHLSSIESVKCIVEVLGDLAGKRNHSQNLRRDVAEAAPGCHSVLS